MFRQRNVLIGLLALFCPTVALAASEQAQSKYVPWSGYWWPIRDGGLQSPLKKYDAATGKQAAKWEAENNPAHGAEQWHGFCHAWSASAIMEQEPKGPKGDFSLGEL
jgi:hypothetical protein